VGFVLEVGIGGVPKDRARAVAAYRAACKANVVGACRELKRLKE
jgi:TPR repeat protein